VFSAHEHPVLYGHGSQLAGAHSEKGVAALLRPGRPDGEALPVSFGPPQGLLRGVQKPLPAVGAHHVGEKRTQPFRCGHRVQAVMAAFLLIDDPGRQLSHFPQRRVDHRPITHLRTQHFATGFPKCGDQGLQTVDVEDALQHVLQDYSANRRIHQDRRYNLRR